MIKRLKVSVSVLASVFVVSGCAQFTTSDQELADMKRQAEIKGDAYIDCVKQEALAYQADGKDVSYVADAAGRKCQTDMDAYEESLEKYYSSQYMVTTAKLEDATGAIKGRAETEVAEILLKRDEQDRATRVAGAAAGTAVGATVAAGSGTSTGTAVGSASAGSSPVAAGTSGAAMVAGAGGWTAEQRIYIDCMEDQGRKYASLEETAATIAEVAHSRCDDYMGGPNPALEKEGRTAVMGAVFDARLPAPR